MGALLFAVLLGSYFQPESGPTLEKGAADSAVIKTVAGDENRGDGLLAVQAVFIDASGVAVDSVGNVYVADKFDHRVRRVDVATGVITTVVGTGERGFEGDGGPAMGARLSFPGQMTFDADDNLYLSDMGNKRIRRIDAETGIITTIIGDGTVGNGGDGGPATEAQLGQPLGVAVDDRGFLYVADRANHVVRRVDLATGIVTRFAGSGDQGFTGDGIRAINSALSGPEDVAVDSTGSVYIADSSNHRIRVVDPDNGLIDTVAGSGSFGFAGDGGPSSRARLFFPSRLSVDEQDNLFFADVGNFRVRRIDAVTGFIDTVAGSGASGSAGDGGSATLAALTPIDISVGSNGTLVVAEGPESRVRAITAGSIRTIAGGLGFDDSAQCTASLTAGIVARVSGVDVDPNGNVYVSDSQTHIVSAVDLLNGTMTAIAGQRGSGGFGGDGGLGLDALLNQPLDVAATAEDLFIVDGENARLRRLSIATGQIDTVAGTGSRVTQGDGGPATAAGFGALTAVTVASSGTIYLIDGNRIRSISPDGTITTIAGSDQAGSSGDGGMATSALFDGPLDLALDGSNGLLVVDSGNHRLRRIDLQSGQVAAVSGAEVSVLPRDNVDALQGNLLRPSGVAVDSDGAIFIGDTLHQRIRRIDPVSNVITTYAGSGVGGFSGDGGAARTAMLFNPERLATDERGRLYLIDQDRLRLRVVEPSGSAINLPAGVGPGDQFGKALAADGEWAAVGVPNDQTGTATGSVAVYRYDGCRVLLDERIEAPTGFAASAFGRSLAISGDRLVIGSGEVANKGNTSQAAIYQRIQQKWEFIQALNDPSGGTPGFGSAVAIDGDTIAIASPENGGNGQVHLFGLDTGGEFVNTDSVESTEMESDFGASIAMDNGNLVVGSPSAEMVRVFEINDDQAGPPITLSQDATDFGAAVAIKGSILAAGAPGEGAAYLYDLLSSDPSAVRLSTTETTASDDFGAAVAVAGDRVHVGAPNLPVASGGTGAVYSFSIDPGGKGMSPVAKTDAAFYQQALGSAMAAILDRLLLAGAPDTADARGDAQPVALDATGGVDPSPMPSPDPDPNDPTSANRQLMVDLPTDPSRACPGFYIAKATAIDSVGRWSMEVLLDPTISPFLQGGLNLGGGFGNDSRPGFAAFNISNSAREPQIVRGEVTVNAPANQVYQIEIIRRSGGEATVIFSQMANTSSFQFEQTLEPGFYTARIFGANGGSGTFTMALSTQFTDRPGGAFQGGVNVGGNMSTASESDTTEGFAAFCIARPQPVRFTTFGDSAFGASGVSNLLLEVLDRDRNVIASSP